MTTFTSTVLIAFAAALAVGLAAPPTGLAGDASECARCKGLAIGRLIRNGKGFDCAPSLSSEAESKLRAALQRCERRHACTPAGEGGEGAAGDLW